MVLCSFCWPVLVARRHRLSLFDAGKLPVRRLSVKRRVCAFVERCLFGLGFEVFAQRFAHDDAFRFAPERSFALDHLPQG